MKTIRSLLCLLLCLCLLGCFLACEKEETPPEVDSDATDAGLLTQLRIEEDDMPPRRELTEWYEDAEEREQLTNAILYAKDESDGLWHCWLYIGSHQAGDTLEYSYDSENDVILFRHTDGDTDTLGSDGVFYFTLDREEEPAFELYQNGSFVGMLHTHGEDPIRP